MEAALPLLLLVLDKAAAAGSPEKKKGECEKQKAWAPLSPPDDILHSLGKTAVEHLWKVVAEASSCEKLVKAIWSVSKMWNLCIYYSPIRATKPMAKKAVSWFPSR